MALCFSARFCFPLSALERFLDYDPTSVIESISAYVQVLHWCIKTKQNVAKIRAPPFTTPRYVII